MTSTPPYPAELVRVARKVVWYQRSEESLADLPTFLSTTTPSWFDNRHWAVDGITDSNRIAFLSGKAGWDVLAISILNGQARTLVSGGFASWPDWAPSGTHFLFAVSLEEIPGIYDRQAGEEGLSRRFV